MNRGLLSLLVFTLCIFVVQQQCTHAGMQATGAKLSQFIANFTDPNYNPTNFGAQVATILQEGGPCFNLVQSFANFQPTSVSRMTAECVFESKGPEANKWKSDPCCNPELRVSQCCAPKAVNETEPRVVSFTSNIQSACGAPNSAKPLVDEFFTSFKNRIDKCDTLFRTTSAAINSQARKMIGCFSLFSQPPNCKSDDDCFGGSCSRRSKRCEFAGPEDTNPVLACLFKQVPPFTVRNIRTKLGFKASTPIEDIRAAFKQATTAQECQDVFGNTIPGNMTTCLSQTKCNLPLNGSSCPTEPACAICDRRGICNFVLPELKTNESCTNSGLCLGGGPGPAPGVQWDKATCENGTFKYCTIHHKCNEMNGCDQSKCESTGECIGYPFAGNSCVFPFDYDNTTESISCRAGRTFFDEGCEDLSEAYNTSAKCTAANGVWYKLPTNQTECEGYKGCYDLRTNIFAPLPESECTKCKLTYRNRYHWNAGVWRNSVFIQPQKWVAPAQVPVNRYVVAINKLRLSKIIGNILSFQIAPAQKTFLQCAFNPMTEVLKSIACDCGTSKGPNGTCYPAPKPVEIGSTRVYAGLQGEFREPSVSIVVSNGTVATAKDVDTVVVSRTPNKDIHASTDIANYYEMFNIHFLNQANAVTGVAVSSGYSVKTASGDAFLAPVRLCIKRDQKVTVGPDYKVAAFATKDGAGALVKSSVELIGSDFSEEMCGDVESSDTYYAAFFTQDAATSPTTSPTKSPSTGSAATVFLACFAIFFSVLGYMF